MTWEKLLTYPSASIPLGAIFRLPSQRPYDGTWYAEPIMDFLLIDLTGVYEVPGFGLISMSGHKAGRIAATPPMMSASSDGKGVSRDWMANHWNEWVYPDGVVSNVWVTEARSLKCWSAWETVQGRAVDQGDAVRILTADADASGEIQAHDFFLFDCSGSVSGSGLGVIALSGPSVGRVVGLIPAEAQSASAPGLAAITIRHHCADWLSYPARATDILTAQPSSVSCLPDGRPWPSKG